MTWSIPSIEELKRQSFNDLLNEKFVHELFAKRQTYFLAKRIIDVIGALLALTALSPVFLLLWILVSFDSKGSAIFSHTRVGKDGKIFTLHKFRTMKANVKDQEVAPTSPEDPRITKLGKFLRRTSIDEMPQFWNVLMGEMSLVGPRPEMEFIVKDYTPIERCRLLVAPGITGLWQIKGRKDLPLHDNVEYDLFYLMHQSIIMDLRILLKTITVVLSGKGAY